MGVDEDVTFVHIWRFSLGPVPNGRLVEILVLAKDYAVHEWTLKMTSAIEEFIFSRRPNMASSYQLTLEPSLRSWSIRTPKMRLCKFSMVVKKNSGEVIQGPYFFQTQPDLESHDPVVRVPNGSPFAAGLQRAMSLRNADLHMEITTTLVVPSSNFNLGTWPGAALPPPAKRDFPFFVIDDKARHDVKIVCQGGVFPMNKAALFQSSNYFRRLFRERKDVEEFNEDAPLQAVQLVITFMMTNTFAPPPNISATLVGDICNLVRRYTVMGPKELILAVEKQACQQLAKDEEQLEKVLMWLITGCEHEMPRLENTANAILLTKHANQVLVEYVGQAPGNAERREIFERLHVRRNMFQQEPIMRFTRQKSRMLRQFQKVAI